MAGLSVGWLEQYKHIWIHWSFPEKNMYEHLFHFPVKQFLKI